VGAEVCIHGVGLGAIDIALGEEGEFCFETLLHKLLDFLSGARLLPEELVAGER
jgi:hypothetical protein